MPPVPFLQDFVVILATAVVVLLASRSLRIPPVVGFLLTGVLIGPHGLRFVTDPDIADLFAEMGVVFLLFAIGLEFSLARLREIRRAFFFGGSLQTGLTIAAVMTIAVALGSPLPQAAFYGFLVALSSTAIILREYDERRELEAPQGKILIGVLLFQDFLIVPLVIVTPVLAGAVEMSARAFGLRLGAGLLLVVAVFYVARRIMPRLLRALVRTRIRELLVLGGLLAGLGMALATASFGFSLALGAFLAGILISESEYSHQLVAEMSPFRDVFTSLFFIAIGMLLDVGLAMERAATVGAVVAGIVLLKAAIVIGVVRALGFPSRVAVLTALGLAQVGEFSFVLARVGQNFGLLAPDAYQVFLASAVLTMTMTPFLIRFAPALAQRTGRLPFFAERPLEDPATTARAEVGGHVVIVGFGVNGRNLAHVLHAVGIPYVVLELNGETVRRARSKGEPVVYGDATRRDVLRACGIDRATTVVFGISDLAAVLRGVHVARDLNPDLHVIVRTRQVSEIDRILAAGADEVVAEEFETSIEILTRLLERLRVPPNVIEAQAKVLHGDTYQRMRGPLAAGRVSETVLDVLAQGMTSVFYVTPQSRAAGRTLTDLDLRRQSGVTVIAVVRGEQSHPNPDPEFRLEAGDSMVLVGSHAQMVKAFDDLEGDSAG